MSLYIKEYSILWSLLFLVFLIAGRNEYKGISNDCFKNETFSWLIFLTFLTNVFSELTWPVVNIGQSVIPRKTMQNILLNFLVIVILSFLFCYFPIDIYNHYFSYGNVGWVSEAAWDFVWTFDNWELRGTKIIFQGKHYNHFYPKKHCHHHYHNHHAAITVQTYKKL